MNPIADLFAALKRENRRAFVPFLAAGDPDLAFTREALPVLAAAGADLIELGLPFSDPIADGPVIQAAYTRALAAGFKLDDLFATLKSVTRGPGWRTPVVLMGSYSLIWKRGPARFLDAALDAGVAGAVVPDLPIEEAAELAKLCEARQFGLTLLVTPTTSPERAARTVAACSGFVYVVSVVGITGSAASRPGAVPELLAGLRALTDRPLCVGFGVSRPEHVAALRDVADGVIVGTALVRTLEETLATGGRAQALAALADQVAALAAPLR